MKIWWGRLTNFIFIVIIIVFFYKRIPDLIHHYQIEGGAAKSIQLRTLDHTDFNSDLLQRPIVVVFWATWCAPCEIELSRINKMIINKEINPEDVIAISIQEEKSVVEETVHSRKYLFQVGLDPTGDISKKFEVEGTPTIVFIKLDKTINWITTGLSPLLGFRIINFLK